jgi:hypothetical protein
MPMKRKFITTIAISLIAVSVIAGVLSVNFSGGQQTTDNLSKEQNAVDHLYTCPVSVGEKTYIVTVVTNETSEPKISLPEFDDSKYFSVDFVGTPGNTPVYFNITYPKNLIGGSFSLVAKYYVQSPDRYTLSNNATHQSVYMTYIHYDTTCHFEIWGTEAAW